MDIPREFSAGELRRFHVTICLRYPPLLACDLCDEEWSPKQMDTGALAPGYWVCPNCHGRGPEGGDGQASPSS